MKKSIFLCMIVFTLAFVSGCFAAEFQNSGLTLTVPDEIAVKLLIELPETGEYGELFSLTEKASVDAAKKSEINWDGVGWLFSIRRVSEEELHEMMCYDMWGARVFAKDMKGDYYLFERPTDVRMVREDYNDPAGIQEWSDLNAWAVTMPQTIIAENYGFTPETRSNTMLDMYLARILYSESPKFTVSTTQFGPLEPDSDDTSAVSVYIRQLTEGVRYEPLYGEETPDGEYVTLDFPDDDMRFDFFLLDGKENLVRQVWFHGEDEMMYRAVFEDESKTASGIMLDLYHMLAQYAGLYDPSADQITGTWMNGRCSITIEKSGEPDQFDVQILWGNSAFETSSWTMTAEKVGSSSSLLRYENGKHSMLRSTAENEISEEILYENGIGTFAMQNENELLWYDETGHAADGSVFNKTK